MYLEQLRSFCAVVEQGSHTRAARLLHLTQPAVSEHVRGLERSLGVGLLTRVGSRLIPTEAGEAAYQHGLEVVRHIDGLRETINALKGLRGGRIILAAGISVGNYVLPQLLSRFRHQYPEVSIELRIDNAPRVFDQVLRGAADFGIALGYRVPDGIVAQPFYRDPLVLVVAPGHPLVGAWRGAIPRAVLATVPLVALSEDVTTTRRLCDEWLRSAGIEPRIDMEFDSSEPIKRVVSSGAGAALLYRSNVTMEVEAGLLTILPVAGPPLFGEFVLARRPRQRLTPAAHELLRMIGEGLAEAACVELIDTEAMQRFLHHGEP